jgi:replication factor C subunit 2/4
VDDSGIEALIFSADGDMRQAINNLQSAYFGFGYINADHVFKVCDQPHPVAIQSILSNCIKGNIDEAAECIRALYDTGYSTLDIINTVSRVTNNYDDIEEAVRSDFINEIGETHTRILDGHNSVIQLTGLVSRLCRVAQQ